MDGQRFASWSRRHPDVTDLAIGVASGILVFAGTLVQRGTEPDALLAAGSLGVAVAAVVLWSLRRRRDREGRAAAALLEQRLGIARELHDVVAHHVSVIGIQSAAARRSLDRAPHETAEALTAIEGSSRAAVLEMQRLVTSLRQPDESGPPGPASPPPTLADLPALVDRMRSAGLEVVLSADDATGVARTDDAFAPTVVTGIPAPAQVALFRVVQEALTNTLRHAGPVAVTVSLRRVGGEAVVTIEHGPGMRSRPVPAQSGGMGLPGMRERVGAVGGTLDAGPRPDGGFAVTARVPVDPA